jgi:hypothetical protein
VFVERCTLQTGGKGYIWRDAVPLPPFPLFVKKKKKKKKKILSCLSLVFLKKYFSTLSSLFISRPSLSDHFVCIFFFLANDNWIATTCRSSFLSSVTEKLFPVISSGASAFLGWISWGEEGVGKLAGDDEEKRPVVFFRHREMIIGSGR